MVFLGVMSDQYYTGSTNPPGLFSGLKKEVGGRGLIKEGEGGVIQSLVSSDCTKHIKLTYSKIPPPLPPTSRLDYQPLFGKMSPRSTPEKTLFLGRKAGPEGAAEIKPTQPAAT